MDELKLYIGTKLILGTPMDQITFLTTIKGLPKPNYENSHGYKVIYPDGYVSWSPKDVFENAYREVTAQERELF